MVIFAGLLLTSASVSISVADNFRESVEVQFSNHQTDAVPDFQKHVVPLLGKLGCNSAKCHGSFQGQGGFRLSLFGFNFRADHAALHGDGRIDELAAEESLILLKATAQVEHEGGKRFDMDSWEYNLLHRWVTLGGKGALEDGREVSRAAEQDAGAEDEVAIAGDLFDAKIKPLLENHCYECHGFDSRKGNLSLTARQRLLIGGDSGPAIVPGRPHESLMVQLVASGKGDRQMPPSGKLKPGQIEDLEEWIRLGAHWPGESELDRAASVKKLVELRCDPGEVLFDATGDRKQLRVIAEWEDGEQQDVTCLCRFQANDDSVAEVNPDGAVISTGPGDTHIVVCYDNGVTAIPVMRPFVAKHGAFVDGAPPTDPEHPIDRMVNAKLGKLGLQPSALCTDAEFLRRVSIDMTGTLPDPAEVKAFLIDQDPAKRDRKVDELLERPSYAAWWSNKLCDFTGCNPKSISSLLEVAREDGYVRASQWYDWIYERVARNEPYDRIAEGIMLSDLSGRGEGMPTFWKRQSLKESKDTAMSVAHAFLGIQLQCAECHKHPFDQWTQSDFRDFSRFFESVTLTKRESVVAEAEELGLLRSQVVALEVGDDPRQPVMEWMRRKDNPWFARAFVNRVWAAYFHVGIVDPPDQFTPANPPSNPELLSWLTVGFVDHQFDMKWLHRQIVTSRAYQRSWIPNATNRLDRRNYSRAIPRRIPAEILYDGLKQVTSSEEKMQLVRNDLRRRASGHLSMRMAGTHAMKVFGKPDRSVNCDCERVNEPTLLQSIFTQNDPLVRMRIWESDWIYEIEDAEAEGQRLGRPEMIEQVWLRTVGRYPNDAEQQRAIKHLEQSKTMAEGIADLVWAMVNTKEFLLNH